MDAEDELSMRLNKAFAMVAICATAARSHECENDQLALTLEAARDVLNGVYEPLEDITKALEAAYSAPSNTPQEPPKPEDERLVGSAIRLSQMLTDQVDAWGEKQTPPLSRSEAIRALIEKGLSRK